MLNRTDIKTGIAVLTAYLENPDSRYRDWSEKDLARLEARLAASLPTPAPATEAMPRKTADALIREGRQRVIESTASIVTLIETKIPGDPAERTKLRLQAEDVLASLDDAEFKFTRALSGIRPDKSRDEDVKKLETSLARIRELRKAFTDDFLTRLNRSK